MLLVERLDIDLTVTIHECKKRLMCARKIVQKLQWMGINPALTLLEVRTDSRNNMPQTVRVTNKV